MPFQFVRHLLLVVRQACERSSTILTRACSFECFIEKSKLFTQGDADIIRTARLGVCHFLHYVPSVVPCVLRRFVCRLVKDLCQGFVFPTRIRCFLNHLCCIVQPLFFIQFHTVAPKNVDNLCNIYSRIPKRAPGCCAKLGSAVSRTRMSL